jgi:hypothetical protein
MKLVSATLSICFAFTLIIYLSGLKAEHSIRYEGGLFVFPIILILFAIFCLVYKDKEIK